MGSECCKKRKVLEEKVEEEDEFQGNDNDIEINLLSRSNRESEIDLNNNIASDQKIEEEKNTKVIPLFNPILNLLPTIIMYFECDCTINEELYDKLKEEISEVIDKKYFSIIELQKGSAFIKMVLINELAQNGIISS